MENLSGQHIDRYEILELLGKGGMAMVYKAYDTRLEREVAIKIIRQDAFPPEILHDVLKRFEREAKSLARLSHPNIVKVLDYGEYEGSPFLVMEYFPGGTLKEKIGEPISWQEAMRLLLPIARGVEYAHNREVIHRDIKPANILMAENGQPTLSDFGIAKLFQDENTTVLTGSGVAMGTPEYMAPEQWTGETGYKSDMYSLGIILYEMVTGRRPYRADTPGGVFLKQVTEPLPFPSGVVANLPKAVEGFLFKALAKEPADRFPDLGAFIKEIENLLSNDDANAQTSIDATPAKRSGPESVLKTPVSSISKPAASSYRRVAIFGGVGVVLVGIGVVAIIALIIGLPKIQGTLTTASTSTPITATEPPELTATEALEVTSVSAILPAEITDDKNVQMILVSAGKFTMGSNADDELLAQCKDFDPSCESSWQGDEQPSHTVSLDAFYMDRYEVTNALYAACVDAGACEHPTQNNSANRADYYGNPEYDNFPVVYVDWNMAQAYCEWRGARLPTEAEWEKAARGTEGFIYPWGEETDATSANYNGDAGDTTAVGSYESGQSPYGMYDMAGNVWEWVSDYYSETYYQNSPSANPSGPESGELHVVRGGSWYDHPYLIRTSVRNAFDPNFVENNFGIRCASPAP